ncbi:MAG: hypothetical protein KAH12_11400 [Anaerolineales bacterium]|nr:hypothetical protein [Anaerolineales bacterium]
MTKIIEPKFGKKIRDFFLSADKINPWVGLLISFLCVVLIQGSLALQPFDDAFITYRYARNISQGLGFVYNPGERVLGTTTPLFTLLLSLIAYIAHPGFLSKASFIISIMADTFNVWLIFSLSNSIFKNRGIALLTSMVFLLQPFRLDVVGGGMETSLFITALLMTYTRYIQGERSFSTSTWAAITFLIRPDAVLALIPIYMDWFIHDKRVSINAGSIFLLVISPWMIWSTVYFGSPIPHSVIAKSVTYSNPLGQAAFIILTFFGTGTPGPYTSPYFLIPAALLGVPVLTIGLRVLFKNQSQALVMALYPIIYTAVMILLNPSMFFSWYFIPLMPGLLILMMGVVWYGLKLERKTKLIVASGLSLILLLVPAVLLNKLPSITLSRTREAAYWDACNYLSNHDLAGKSILAPDIGVIGWCLEDVNILDPIGLVSPESLIYNENLPPKELVSLQLLMDQQPDYIISLAHYIAPYIVENNEFQESYELIFEEDLLIVGNDHRIYIFKHNN